MSKRIDREPTQEMFDSAVCEPDMSERQLRDLWQAMYDAAPAAPAWMDAEVDAEIDKVLWPEWKDGSRCWASDIRQVARHFAGLAAAAPACVSDDDRTLCYLIERGQQEDHVPTIWWTGVERNGEPYAGRWTELANEAMRFRTAPEAQRYAESGDGPGHLFRVTEHIFMGRDHDPEDWATLPQHPPQDTPIGFPDPRTDFPARGSMAADPDVAALVAESDDLCSTWPHSHPFRVLNEKLAAALGTLQARIAELAVTAQREVDAALKAEAERDKLRELLRAACSTLETKHVMSMASGRVQKWRKDDAALKGEA